MRNAMQRRIELMKSFQSAKSINKKLKLFQEMEKFIPESDLGVDCWTLAANLFLQGRSPQQVLAFGNRALRIFISNSNTDDIPFMGKIRSRVPVGNAKNQCDVNHNSSFYIACVCHLLASACLDLNRYNESLGYLNWGSRNLCLLLEDDDCVNNCVSDTLVCMLVKQSRVEVDIGGKWEDVIVHSKKALEISEKIKEEDCIEIGDAHMCLVAAYLELMNYKEALPYCLKALEIYTKHYGSSSMEVAEIMRQLANIYSQLGKHKKALEQSQLSQSIFKNMIADSAEFLAGEYETGGILFRLGRYEEALNVLKHVVSRPNTQGSTRGLAFVNMANALLRLGKLTEAKKHLERAEIIFEKKDMLPISVANGFEYMSRLYEKMNDVGKETTLLRRALNIPEIPSKLLAKGSARLFSLISLSDNEKEGIAYMEEVVGKLKEKFGAEHCEVGYGYRNLGAACLKSGHEELAVNFMVKAKNILNVALGPHHLDSLRTSQTLAETYATLKRYDLAVGALRKVVEGLKGLGPTEHEKLDKAISLLQKMELATGSDSEDFAVKN